MKNSHRLTKRNMPLPDKKMSLKQISFILAWNECENGRRNGMKLDAEMAWDTSAPKVESL